MYIVYVLCILSYGTKRYARRAYNIIRTWVGQRHSGILLYGGLWQYMGTVTFPRSCVTHKLDSTFSGFRTRARDLPGRREERRDDYIIIVRTPWV